MCVRELIYAECHHLVGGTDEGVAGCIGHSDVVPMAIGGQLGVIFIVVGQWLSLKNRII